MASLFDIRADKLRGIVEAHSGDPGLWRVAHGESLRIIEDSWGVWQPAAELDGGDVWRRIQELDDRISRAKDAGDKDAGPDFYMRLMWTQPRVERDVARLMNLHEARSWYDAASPIERRVLQDRPDILRQKWADESGLGGFLGDLERDRELAVSPNLPAARAKRDQLMVEVNNLWEASKTSERALETGRSEHGISRVLSQVQVVTRAVATGPDAGIYRSFAKRPALTAPPGVGWVSPEGVVISEPKMAVMGEDA